MHKLQSGRIHIIFIIWFTITFNPFIFTLSLSNQCNIEYCSSCDPITKFCYQCDLPFKPGYLNQSICTRCHNNCAVCQKQGNDSKGDCLSCQFNFDYQRDKTCETFYVWVYMVTIGAYVLFAIIMIIVFCIVKRNKERKENQWFQQLEEGYEKVDNREIVGKVGSNVNDNFNDGSVSLSHNINVSQEQFNKKCQQIIQLLKQSSQKNTFIFEDRYFKKQIKITSIKLLKPQRPSQSSQQTFKRKLKILAYDNSQWHADGYIILKPSQSHPHPFSNLPQPHLSIWFAKIYNNKVYSEQLSKVIVYESENIRVDEIKGKWYYYQRQDVKGVWGAKRR